MWWRCQLFQSPIRQLLSSEVDNQTAVEVVGTSLFVEPCSLCEVSCVLIRRSDLLLDTARSALGVNTPNHLQGDKPKGSASEMGMNAL